MTDSAHKHAPQRVLRRAAGLVSSNGKPVADELCFDDTPAKLPSRQSKLTNSIKRSLTQVKRVSLNLTRSKSTPVPPTIPEKQQHVQHEEEQKRKGPGKLARSLSVRDGKPIILNRSSSSQYYNQHKRFSLPLTAEISRPAYPSLPSYAMTDVAVPDLLQQGTPMTKVSSKRQKKFDFKVDPDQGQIVYESNRTKISAYHNLCACPSPPH